MNSIYDNTVCGPCGSEESLTAMEKRVLHDMEFGHEIEHFDEIIQGEVDGKIKRCYFRAWKTRSCGQPGCHHPQHSIMPLQPYKIEFVSKP